MRSLAAALLVGSAIGLAGCGGGVDETASAGAANQQNARSERGGGGTDPRCLNQLGGLLGSLDRLRDQLVAGVTYEQYVAELNDVRAAYAKLPLKRLGLDCLSRVGTTAERSLNRHIEAAEIWSECVEVPGCQSSSVEAKLQRKWRQGSSLLSRAERRLAGRAE
jgi:hypothetical protein